MSLGMNEKLNVLSPSSEPPPAASKYKPSIYNHFVEKDDVVWGINFMSRAFVRLSPDTYRKARGILDGEIETNGSASKLKDQLIHGNFLIPEEKDEIQLLKVRNQLSRFGGRGLTLIIAPTLRCNFGCEYCYVDLNANKMKPEARERLGKFWDRKLHDDSNSEVVWTGGDPSLAMDVVEDLSLRFLESCERKGTTYKASLITNGYLLHDKMRQHLRNSKIERLQISLDGSREFHDSNRCLPNGTPTYDRILENVEDTCDEFKIFLRINVDANNHEAIPELLDDLEQRGLASRLYVYFAHVDDVNENSAAYHDSCLPVEHYAKVEAGLVRLAVSRGFRMGGRTLSNPVKTFCGANSKNYYVVDSKANLLKCYHDFGQADRHGIGHIGDDGDEVVTNPYNLMKWLGWDPFSIQECRDCKVLPMCMGGCSHKIMNSDMQIEKGCLRLRFSVDEIVDLFGEMKTDGLDTGCSGCAAAVHV